MIILKTSGWEDYQLIDSGDGQRLERFGKYVIARPDPQAIWKPLKDKSVWGNVDAYFDASFSVKGEKGGPRGRWVFKKKVPEKWQLQFKDLKFIARLTPFKHTGVFPEQHLQWEWIRQRIDQIKSDKQSLPSNDGRSEIKILNLFGYTGIASIAAAAAGAKVTHVDASKSSITWARENQEASGLVDKPIRWILDDAIKFCQREVKRGAKYDGIIMDPPVFGHGPSGETWDFNKSFPQLLEVCKHLLSDKPLFIVINAYAISSSSLMLENMLKDLTKNLSGTIEVGELAIEEKDSDRLLSTGIFGRWYK